jgi:hypothetical protein
VDAALQRAYDADKAADFSAWLLSALNHGACCLMASLGHRKELVRGEEMSGRCRRATAHVAAAGRRGARE